MSSKIGSGIYKIENTLNGMCYVGSSKDIGRRWSVHLCGLKAGVHPNQKLQRAFAKYGMQAFTWSVLEFCDKTSLIQREQFWIDALSAYSDGYNLRPLAASPLGRKLSAEHKAKISAGGKGRVFTKETKAKISAALSGLKRSPEHVEKMRRSKIGFKHSSESVAKIVAGLKNRAPISAETRQKLSIAAKRRMQKLKESGYKVSEESRIKRSQSLRGRVVSEETRKKLAAAYAHRAPISSETRLKMSLSAKARNMSRNAAGQFASRAQNPTFEVMT